MTLTILFIRITPSCAVGQEGKSQKKKKKKLKQKALGMRLNAFLQLNLIMHVFLYVFRVADVLSTAERLHLKNDATELP